jgi:hypothetical protein
MFMNNLGRAQFAAVHRKFFMTEKQRLWADVYRCAYMRWQDSHYSDKGEWTTMVAALGLGDQFWENF